MTGTRQAKVFDRAYAPSTLSSFLRAFTFGHVRQVDAVASRFTLALAERTGLLGQAGDTGTVLVDLDDTIVEVHGYAKQGAGFGYSGVRGLNALLATVTTEQAAPVIAAQRLRKGAVGSSRGAVRLATAPRSPVASWRRPSAATPCSTPTVTTRSSATGSLGTAATRSARSSPGPPRQPRRPTIPASS